LPDAELPTPDGLGEFPVSYQAKAIYALLWDHRDQPLSMQEIRDRLGELGQQEQLDRRRRELNRYFVIERIGRTTETRYRLKGRKPRSLEADAGISESDRASVLRHGRCAMCGRTPLEHGVVLQVDHKIPKEWGGTDAVENLQPLCEECNRGKKNLFASYDKFADEIRLAIGHESVHMRIGELLKAFADQPVRSDILELVASPPGDYQEDWQKRLRELRVLGWKIEASRRRDGTRVRAFYRLVTAQPWPPGSIRAEIKRAEKGRGY
jgi:5-methylcytosine-specific restriction endonuclease McrA